MWFRRVAPVIWKKSTWNRKPMNKTPQLDAEQMNNLVSSWCSGISARIAMKKSAQVKVKYTERFPLRTFSRLQHRSSFVFIKIMYTTVPIILRSNKKLEKVRIRESPKTLMKYLITSYFGIFELEMKYILSIMFTVQQSYFIYLLTYLQSI